MVKLKLYDLDKLLRLKKTSIKLNFIKRFIHQNELTSYVV